MKVEVPYQFTLGSKAMHPGTYTFDYVEDQNMLLVKSPNSEPITELVMTRISGPDDFLRNGSIVFDRTDGGRIISEVWIPGMDGLLLHAVPRSSAREVLLASFLSPNGTVPGDIAYKMTCGKCHGPNGKGNPDADHFFKIVIPRLNSDMVQRQSNEQLRILINQGSKVMPPVEIDEGGFRHRLPPQDVEAVIAYVRTFKN
jgi:Cytochrome C oxidase, cbb3-type, subunit III